MMNEYFITYAYLHDGEWKFRNYVHFTKTMNEIECHKILTELKGRHEVENVYTDIVIINWKKLEN